MSGHHSGHYINVMTSKQHLQQTFFTGKHNAKEVNLDVFCLERVILTDV